MALEANATVLCLFSRPENSRCIRDTRVIIDVSYRCGVFGVFFSLFFFFFLQRVYEKSIVTVTVMVADFYLAV